MKNRITALIGRILPELMWLVGVVLLYWGVNEIFPPAAKIITGILFLFGGWRMARRMPHHAEDSA